MAVSNSKHGDDYVDEAEDALDKVQDVIGDYDDFKDRAAERKKKREDKKNKKKGKDGPDDPDDPDKSKDKDKDKNKENDPLNNNNKFKDNPLGNKGGKSGKNQPNVQTGDPNSKSKDDKDDKDKDDDDKDDDKDKDSGDGGDEGPEGGKGPKIPKLTPASIAKSIASKASGADQGPEEVLLRTTTALVCCCLCILFPVILALVPFLALFYWANPSITNNMAGVETTESADADFEDLNLSGRNPMFQEDSFYSYGDMDEEAPVTEESFANEGLTYTVDEQYLEMAKLLYDHTNVAMQSNEANWHELVEGFAEGDDDALINDERYNSWELNHESVPMPKLFDRHKERADSPDEFYMPPITFYLNPKGYEEKYQNLQTELGNDLSASIDIEGGTDQGITYPTPEKEKTKTVKFEDGTYSGKINDGPVLGDTRNPGFYDPGNVNVGLSFDPGKYRNGNLGNNRMPKPKAGQPYFDKNIKMIVEPFNQSSASNLTAGNKWDVEPKLGVVYTAGDANDRPVIPFGTRLYIESYGYGIVTGVDGSLSNNELSVFLPTGKSISSGSKDVAILRSFPWEHSPLWEIQHNGNASDYTEEELNAMKEKAEREGGGNLKDFSQEALDEMKKQEVFHNLDRDKNYYIVEQRTDLIIPPDPDDKYSPATDPSLFNFDPTVSQFDHIKTEDSIRNMTGHSLMENQIAYILAAFSTSRGNSSPIGGYIREFKHIMESNSGSYDADKIFKADLALVSESKTRIVWTEENYYVEVCDDDSCWDELRTDYYWKSFSYPSWYLDSQFNAYSENEILKSFFFEKDVAKNYETLHIRHKPNDENQVVFSGSSDSNEGGGGVAEVISGNQYILLTEEEAKEKAKEVLKYSPSGTSLNDLIVRDEVNDKANGYKVTQDQLRKMFNDLSKEEWKKYGYAPNLTTEERESGMTSVTKKEAETNFVFDHIMMSDYRDWLLVYLYDCDDSCESENRVTVKDRRTGLPDWEWLKKDVEYGYGVMSSCDKCGAPFVPREMKFKHWALSKIMKFGKSDEEKEEIDEAFKLPRQEHVLSNGLDYHETSRMDDDGEITIDPLSPHTVSTKIKYFAENSLESIEVATRLEEFGITNTNQYAGFGGDASGIIDIAYNYLREFESNTRYVNNNDAVKGRGRPYFNTLFYGSNQGQPWCAIFVSVCAEEAGISTDIIPRTAGVKEHVNFAKKENRWHHRSSGYVPQPGDLVVYQFDYPGQYKHIGLVTEVEGGMYKAVEGNTSGESRGNNGDMERNGNSVGEKHRSLDYSGIIGWIEVHYPATGIDGGEPRAWNPQDFTPGKKYSAHVTAYYPYNDAMQGGFKDRVGRYLYPPDQTVAAPKSVPVGTILLLTGTGTQYDNRLYTVTDTGGAIVMEGSTMRIDILTGSRDEAYSFGRRKGAQVQYMTPKAGVLSRNEYQYLYRQRKGGPSWHVDWDTARRQGG